MLPILIEPNVTIVFDDQENEYQVLDFIGNGNFGYVYKLERISDKSPWALKSLQSSFPSQKEKQSFQNESAMAVKVSHVNTTNYIYVHDGSVFEQLPPYIIMDYANGGTLQDIIVNSISSNTYISNESLIEYFNQLIDGMEHVNNVLVHRDIKPDNILIHNGVLKITDFGLSKIAQEGTRLLTFKGFGHLRYLAPEGWNQEKNTTQMDIYSMGITLYELATLKYPYDIKNESDVQEWKNAHLFKTPNSPKSINTGLSTSMTQVILKMMEKRTAKRYKTWGEIREDLLIDKQPATPHSDIIDNMVNTRVLKDNSIKEKQLKEEKERVEKLEYVNTIHYQFETEIYEPIKEFIEEFNLKYTNGDKIRLSSLDNRDSSEISTKIRLVSGNVLTIHLNALFDEDFNRDIKSQFSDKTYKQIVRPLLRGNKVIAWGFLKNLDGMGFNLILTENKDDLYGEWSILINNNNTLFGQRRIEPFPFEFGEIEKEIQFVNGGTHIYTTTVESFSMERFHEYIVRFN